MQIRSAQNVGKVLISRKKLAAPLGATFDKFPHGPHNAKFAAVCLFPLGRPIGCHIQGCPVPCRAMIWWIRAVPNVSVPCPYHPCRAKYFRAVPCLAVPRSWYGQDESRKVNNDELDLIFFTETFDLLSAGQFEILVFRPQPQGGQICVSWISRRRRRRRRRTNSQIQIQAPRNAPRDEILPQGNPHC